MGELWGDSCLDVLLCAFGAKLRVVFHCVTIYTQVQNIPDDIIAIILYDNSLSEWLFYINQCKVLANSVAISYFLIKAKQIRDYSYGTSHTFMDLLLPSPSLHNMMIS